MNFDFAAFLMVAAAVTGVIWALDAAVWAPRRRLQGAGGEAGTSTGAAAPREPLLVEYSRAFFPIILIVLLLRSFVVEPFRIPSGSMEPTLLPGDFILVNKFDFGLRLPAFDVKVLPVGEPTRGEVIVFRYPRNPSVDYIKRVVGLPGDHIAYRDKIVYINGKPQKQTVLGQYINEDGLPVPGVQERSERLGNVTHDILVYTEPTFQTYPCMPKGGYTVPPHHYFMMGDNRDNSNDSRYWCAVPEKNLVGRAFLIWMSWDMARGGIAWQRIGDRLR
ncbi:signal peptidase I [bacterium BMS3Bbin12]|nr:signal peptidase I [bacterium BMS3Bbin12]GBE50983.1 signal peptidase I [bacterium BMS3Bbin13]HDJ86878.1 signal peptidase I [Chromatiales bacterium]